MGVWIDTDMGFDDIAAIMVVQSAGLAIDGISLVFGNATLEAVSGNAAGAVAAFGWSMPFHQGRAGAGFARNGAIDPRRKRHSDRRPKPAGGAGSAEKRCLCSTLRLAGGDR